MQSMYEHRLDTSLDLSRKIDSLSVREQLMLRTAPPPVTPRLSESLLSQAHQASLRQAVQNPYLDVSSAESYLIVDANHAIKKVCKRSMLTQPSVTAVSVALAESMERADAKSETVLCYQVQPRPNLDKITCRCRRLWIRLCVTR